MKSRGDSSPPEGGKESVRRFREREVDRLKEKFELLQRELTEERNNLLEIDSARAGMLDTQIYVIDLCLERCGKMQRRKTLLGFIELQESYEEILEAIGRKPHRKKEEPVKVAREKRIVPKEPPLDLLKNRLEQSPTMIEGEPDPAEQRSRRFMELHRALEGNIKIEQSPEALRLQKLTTDLLALYENQAGQNPEWDEKVIQQLTSLKLVKEIIEAQKLLPVDYSLEDVKNNTAALIKQKDPNYKI